MIWITVNAWTVMISVCLRITEMKREIFVPESRNANERPEGFGKENSKKCFCRIPLVFYVEGERTWITVNALNVMISVCLCITEMRRKYLYLES